MSTSDPPSSFDDDWAGIGSTAAEPSADYWRHLAGYFATSLVETLRKESERRANEFDSSLFGPADQSNGTKLLETFRKDGWVDIETREIPPEDDGFDRDPDKPARYRNVYVRALAKTRDVDWVVLVHGMNTRGRWQEKFSWYMATTYGRSVPVSIYKYGMIVFGVVLFWRRHKLKRILRDRLLTLQAQAERQGFHGPPDLIAHSFGTWLIGRIIEEEPERPEPHLRFGRIILTGCILRPDYDWASAKRAGIVEEILNHYGTADIVVPLSQWTIPSSGPSGHRGFDSMDTLNVEATSIGHSDLFREEGLRDSYVAVWRPFLTLPAPELSRLPNLRHPADRWRPLPLALSAKLFPWIALPTVVSLVVLLLVLGGSALDSLWPAALWGLTMFGAATLLYSVVCAVLTRRMD